MQRQKQRQYIVHATAIAFSITMKAVLLNGSSHGSILHCVPDSLPEWTNSMGQTYSHIRTLLQDPIRIALYAYGKPNFRAKETKDTLEQWKHLLADLGQNV